MGITNSSLIKLAVEALTKVLNVVNALTSGFGTLNGGVGSFVNTLLKLSVAITGMKGLKLLAAGGFNSIAGIFGKDTQPLKQVLTNAMGKTMSGDSRTVG